MRRSQSVVLVLLLLGAALLFLVGGRVWSHAVVPAGSRAPVRLAVTGGQLAGGLSAFALGALAGAGALLATHGRARVAVGGLLAALGAGAVAVTAHGLSGASATVTSLARSRAVAASASPSVPLNAWPYLAVLGALLLLVAGVVTLALAASWGALGQRYETPAARPAPRDPEVAAWDALDRGEDPTTA